MQAIFWTYFFLFFPSAATTDVVVFGTLKVRLCPDTHSTEKLLIRHTEIYFAVLFVICIYAYARTTLF